jgi:hypothetical protein
MAHIVMTDAVVCDGCGIEMAWAAVVVDGATYCCQDCAAGQVCECDYPPEEDRLAEQQAVLVAFAGYG